MLDRQTDLLNVLLARGRTPVQELAAAIGASPATVRRDLAELALAGRVERSRGAARIATAAQGEVAFTARERENLPAKRAIAAAAAALVRPGGTLFLDAGTTVLQLARRIGASGRPATVITNGLVVAQELAHLPAISMTLIGGRMRPENMSTVGPLACAMIDRLWIDQLFLGATALDCEGRLSSHDPDEAAANARMIARAGEVVVLVDASKIGARATHEVARLDGPRGGRPMRLVTDAALPAELVRRAAAAEVAVTVAMEGADA